MASASVLTIQKSNRGVSVLAHNQPKTASASALIAARLKAIFPVQTWAYVEKLLYPGQQRESLVKHRLACRRDFDVEELASLIRTEHGFDFICDLMGEEAARWPLWFRVVRIIMRAADARKQRAKIAAELNGALYADADLSAAIGRADAALAFQDQDFMQPHLDALRATGGVLGGAVAPAVKPNR